MPSFKTFQSQTCRINQGHGVLLLFLTGKERVLAWRMVLSMLPHRLRPPAARHRNGLWQAVCPGLRSLLARYAIERQRRLSLPSGILHEGKESRLPPRLPRLFSLAPHRSLGAEEKSQTIQLGISRAASRASTCRMTACCWAGVRRASCSRRGRGSLHPQG
jgi:hypothetical protein